MALPYAERRAALAELELDGRALAGARPRRRPRRRGAGRGARAGPRGHRGQAPGLAATSRAGARAAGSRSSRRSARSSSIGGWLPGEGRRARPHRRAAASACMTEDGGPALRRRVGTGFTEDELDRLARRCSRRSSTEKRRSTPGPSRRARRVWVRARARVRVEFAEWTQDGQLRAPVLQGAARRRPLRRARGPHAQERRARARSTAREIKLSNLDKVLYPRPASPSATSSTTTWRSRRCCCRTSRGRALTLKRYPDGVDGDFFYEKNAPSHRPEWVRTATAMGRDIDYVVVDEVADAGVAGATSPTSSCTPRSRGPSDLDRPTMLAFDLDPGPPARSSSAAGSALRLEGMFDGLGLESCAKTSGSKGHAGLRAAQRPRRHLRRRPSRSPRRWPSCSSRREPELVVSRQTKALRKGKVLVDWSQNDEHKTTVNVYSLRARERPTVSTPLSWDEVREAHEAGDAERLQCTARGGARPRRAPRRPVRARAGGAPGAAGAVGLRSRAQRLQDAERLLGLRAHEGEGARGVVHVLEGHLVALDAEAGDPADGGPLVTLGLTVAQQDADLQGVVEPDGGQLGGGRADQREVAGGQGAAEAGVGGAGG